MGKKTRRAVGAALVLVLAGAAGAWAATLWIFEIHPIDLSGDSRRLDHARLRQSLNLGTRFLLNNQLTAGNFHYAYDWVAGTRPDEDNSVRQAGALWGLATLHRHRPSAELATAVLRGIAFFRAHGRVYAERRFVVYPGDRAGSTGTVALLALAYVDFLRAGPGLPSRVRARLEAELTELLRELARLQDETGRFHGEYHLGSGIGRGHRSPYADGETLLALTRAAKYLGYDEYIDTVRRAAPAMHRAYVVDARAETPDSDLTKGFYQWGSMSFHELAGTDWVDDPGFYGDAVIELADWMIDVHDTLWRTRNTAYAHEGLVHAYVIARRRGDTAHAEKFAAVIDRGLAKLVGWQVGGPSPNRFLRAHPTDDPLAVGGILNHRAEPLLRIDVTQHQMHATLLALEHVYQAPPRLEVDARTADAAELLLLGDTSFGEGYQRAIVEHGGTSVLAARGYDWPLARFRRLLAAADASVINLEAALTDRSDSPYAGAKNYVYADDPDRALPVYRSHGIDAAALANNHTLDFGPAGLADTLAALEGAGIAAFGAGPDRAHAELPLLLRIELADGVRWLGIWSAFEYRLPYAWRYEYYAAPGAWGVLELDPTRLGRVIGRYKAAYPGLRAIVFPHWGTNYAWTDEAQRDTARALVAAGADLVVGHGAHRLQEVERIDGRWVAYGLGNFMFLSPGRYAREDAPAYSLLACLELRPAQAGDRLRLYPVMTDNRRNGYQGRFVTHPEFVRVQALLLERMGIVPEAAPWQPGEDAHGRFLELAL